MLEVFGLQRLLEIDGLRYSLYDESNVSLGILGRLILTVSLTGLINLKVTLDMSMEVFP